MEPRAYIFEPSLSTNSIREVYQFWEARGLRYLLIGGYGHAVDSPVYYNLEENKVVFRMDDDPVLYIVSSDVWDAVAMDGGPIPYPMMKANWMKEGF